MIYLFTDFGYAGPYVGELHAVLLKELQSCKPINLMHDAPAYNPKASAYLLAALAKRFQPGDACLAIVDPDVGNENRKPVIINADGVVYCGPDNGLFSQIISQAKEYEIVEILWRPESLSNSFHGRDLFAPALIRYMSGAELNVSYLKQDEIVGSHWPDFLPQIIYADSFGNCVTGIPRGKISSKSKLLINNETYENSETFSNVKKGTAFWYFNSMDLVEVAMNQENVAVCRQLSVGDEISII